MNEFRGFLRGNKEEKAEISTQGDRLTMACFGAQLGADIDLVYNDKEKRDEVHVYVTSGSEYKKDFRFIGAFFINPEGQIQPR